MQSREGDRKSATQCSCMNKASSIISPKYFPSYTVQPLEAKSFSLSYHFSAHFLFFVKLLYKPSSNHSLELLITGFLPRVCIWCVLLTSVYFSLVHLSFVSLICKASAWPHGEPRRVEEEMFFSPLHVSKESKRYGEK